MRFLSMKNKLILRLLIFIQQSPYIIIKDENPHINVTFISNLKNVLFQ